MKIFFLLLLFCFGCAKNPDPHLVQLQMRSMQTRSYAHQTVKGIIKEIVNVLQDEGYIVRNINPELGVLTAEKSVDIEKFSSVFWAYIFSGRQGSWKKQSIVEMTTNISQFQDVVRVRTTFQLKILDNFGRVVKIHPIAEEKYYQAFFDKVQKGVLTQLSLKQTN